jgi:hypothetical protein
MGIRASALAVAMAAAVTVPPTVVSGQGYQPPAGPTMSRYLDYFNAPISPLLDNYHTYVRPRADLRSNLNQFGAALQQQDNRLNQLGNDLARPTAAGPTGTGSTFMNYSHYYGGGTRQRTPTAQRGASRGNFGAGVARGAGVGFGSAAAFRGY